MREDLITQLLIVKWFGQAIIENPVGVNAWLSQHETHKYAEAVTTIKPLLGLPGFIDALKQLPNQEPINLFLQSNPAVEQQLLHLLQVNEKKSAKNNSANLKRPLDLTDAAAAWYKTNPPKLSDAELEATKAFLVGQVKRKVCCFGLNTLGVVSPVLAKFILDDPVVFSQVAADTVPFGAEPILTLGLQAGYCEPKYASHQFFIERFLQFAGDVSVPRPANLSGASAPAHAIQAILLRTGYYKTIQVAIGSQTVSRHIFCDAAVQSGLLTKVVDQVLKPEKHERSGEDIDKSQEAKTILGWDGLPWLGEEKVLGLAVVAKYCKPAEMGAHEQAYDFMKNAPVTAKILLVRNSQQLIALRNHAAGNILEPNVAFAYVTTPAFDKVFGDEVKQVLLFAAHRHVDASLKSGVVITHPHAKLYAMAWVRGLLENQNGKLSAAIGVVVPAINLLLPAEKIPLAEVQLLLTPSALAQANDIKNTFVLWLLVFKLAAENNTADAAVLLHLIPQIPYAVHGEGAILCFKLLAKIEQDVYGQSAAPQSFFPSSKNSQITAQFYCYLHCAERKDAPGDFLPKLFRSNLERYVELVFANPLARSKEFLPVDWFVELPTLLVKVKDKAVVLKRMMDLYKNLYKSNDDHLTWLTALHHFYQQETADAARLFRQLKEAKSSAYENKANTFLENCKSTVVNPLSPEKQERLEAQRDSLNPL